MSTTNRERIDRQAMVAQLTAGGSNPSEVARIMGCHRATVYRDLEGIRERALDRVRMDEEDEARAVQEELDTLDRLFDRARRNLEERTEPGSRDYAANLKAVIDLKRLKLHTAAELGVYVKAPQRHLVLPGDQLANLSGDALENYVKELDEADRRLSRVGARGNGRRK